MENIKIHCPRGYQKQSIYNGNIVNATLQSENKHTKTESSYVIICTLSLSLTHTHACIHSLQAFYGHIHTHS